MLSGSSGEFGMEEGQPSLHFADAVKLDNAAKIGGVIVPDAQLLFSGDFKRSGLDLDISHDDRHFLVRDYFKGENRATLLAPDGSSLSGQIVNSLTGHVDVAQAGARTSAATIIGTVVKLTGDATAVRNGVVIVLNIGDKVYMAMSFSPAAILRSAFPSLTARRSALGPAPAWCSTIWSTTRMGRRTARSLAWYRARFRLLPAKLRKTAI